jgi:hypothetical protein
VTAPAAESPDHPEGHDVARLAEHLKEQIYAALTTIAVVLGLALSGAATHLAVTLSVIGTLLGLWLATIAAEEQAHRIVHGHLMNAAELRHMLFVSSPLLTAAVGPLVLVGLSALGMLPLTAALYVSVGVDTASLFLWGCLSGRKMGTGLVGAISVGLVNLLIGGIVIGIKLVAGH